MSVNLTFVRLVLYSLINCLTQLTMKLAHHGHFPVCMAESVLYSMSICDESGSHWRKTKAEQCISLVSSGTNVTTRERERGWEKLDITDGRNTVLFGGTMYVIPLITKRDTLAPLCINWIPLGLCKLCSVPFCSLQVLPLMNVHTSQTDFSSNWFASIKHVNWRESVNRPRTFSHLSCLSKFRLFSYFDQKFSETSVSAPKADSTTVLRVWIYI